MVLPKKNLPNQPRCLRGFEDIHRYWDRTEETFAAKILPGEYYVTTNDEMIVTVLGSCISACIRDTRLKIGGMNHFMLPMSPGAGNADLMNSQSARYGNFAMEHLINAILKQGGSKRYLEVKLVGGGKIIANMSDIGQRNINFAQQYVMTENLNVIGEDLGDVYPRKVQYYPMTGRLRVKRLRKVHNNTVVSRETEYMEDIAQKPMSGDVELF
jgi:chemotaxis protein CheD